MTDRWGHTPMQSYAAWVTDQAKRLIFAPEAAGQMYAFLPRHGLKLRKKV